ncbi:MAG TPA: hypothetical protein VGF99_20270, partial [Myxococcota bacterium]
MLRSRRPELLLSFFVLVGAASFGFARVRTAESRTIPYQGVLERNGQPVTGEVDARFGLFNVANADTACVATNSCALWSEEQVIDVVDGRFSVMLGDAGPRRLTSAILQSPELFLGVAFKTDEDAAFTALSGTQEIVGAPIVQPGAVTSSSFASNVLFSAKVTYNFDLGDYFASEASPPGWISVGSPVGPNAHDEIAFGLSTSGAPRLKCMVSPLNNAASLAVL